MSFNALCGHFGSKTGHLPWNSRLKQVFFIIKRHFWRFFSISVYYRISASFYRTLTVAFPRDQVESPFPVFSLAFCSASNFSSFSTRFLRSLSGLKIGYHEISRHKIWIIPSWHVFRRQKSLLHACKIGNNLKCFLFDFNFFLTQLVQM